MHIENHRLQGDAGDSAVVWVPSVRHYALKVPKARGLMWHVTGGIGSEDTAIDSARMAAKIRNYRRRRDRAASWHFIVDKDGSIYQSVPTNRGAWHVGAYGVIDGVSYSNVNRATLGIELENAGRLRKFNGKFYTWPYFEKDPKTGEFLRPRRPDPKVEVPAERAEWIDAKDPKWGDYWGRAYFDSFPDAQVEAATQLAAALIKELGLPLHACGYGHFEFAKGVKEDPGPIWYERHQEGVLDRAFDLAAAR